MRVVVGADHRGYELKDEIAAALKQAGHEVLDVGTHSADSVYYPDYARAIAGALTDGRAERGVLVCGSGVGASIAANKIHGVRAALCHDTNSARPDVTLARHARPKGRKRVNRVRIPIISLAPPYACRLCPTDNRALC